MLFRLLVMTQKPECCYNILLWYVPSLYFSNFVWDVVWNSLYCWFLKAAQMEQCWLAPMKPRSGRRWMLASEFTLWCEIRHLKSFS
jgi:hypothetical protein